MRLLSGGALAPVLAVAAGAGAINGCYKPSIKNCQYACDNNVCPSGLVCSAGMCVGAIGESCFPIDALDGNEPTDVHLGEAGCEFGFTASNVDPCSFTGPVGDWIVTTAATFDTDSPGSSGEAAPAQSIHLVSEAGDQLVAVVYVHTLQVHASATITVTGQRPLIILVDDFATIEGAIDFSDVTAACPATPDRTGHLGDNGTGQGGGGGGGGGSFGIDGQFATVAGATGGDGGPAGGDAGGNGADSGNPTQDTALSPILPGCPGGRGGTGHGQAGGAGGLGGGAIQISARNTVTVSGQIRVSGGGGASTGNNGGAGGGGGAGGSILIEGAFWSVPASGFLCANGGGGGASALTLPGETGRCANTTAKGAVSGSGDGGDGEANAFSAIVGQSGGTGFGGGGGGGGVGVIRLTGSVINESGGASPHLSL